MLKRIVFALTLIAHISVATAARTTTRIGSDAYARLSQRLTSKNFCKETSTSPFIEKMNTADGLSEKEKTLLWYRFAHRLLGACDLTHSRSAHTKRTARELFRDNWQSFFGWVHRKTKFYFYPMLALAAMMGGVAGGAKRGWSDTPETPEGFRRRMADGVACGLAAAGGLGAFFLFIAALIFYVGKDDPLAWQFRNIANNIKSFMAAHQHELPAELLGRLNLMASRLEKAKYKRFNPDKKALHRFHEEIVLTEDFVGDGITRLEKNL